MTGIILPGYDDELIGKRLLWQIEREIAANQSRVGPSGPSFHVTVCRSDNETTVTKIAGSIAPGPARVAWARFACRALNREVRAGGTWIVVWCEPRDLVSREPTRLLILWKDWDGDIPVTFDNVQPFEEIVDWGRTWFLEAAFNALSAYREHLRESGIRPRDMIREALGQQSANSRAGGPEI
jgi:hypothetical protein